MKSNKTIIYIILFVLIILGATLLYGELSQNYEINQKTEEKTAVTSEKPKQKALDFEVFSENGESVTLSEKTGKPVVINFWATWCGPCRAELPAFESMYKKYQDKVEFMMVNLTDGMREKKEDVKAFITDNNYSFPVFYDSNQSAAYVYNITSVPLTVFVDADGNIDNYRVGGLRENDLEEYIQNLIK